MPATQATLLFLEHAKLFFTFRPFLPLVPLPEILSLLLFTQMDASYLLHIRILRILFLERNSRTIQQSWFYVSLRLVYFSLEDLSQLINS